MVVELGCGSAAKTGILLRELIRRDGAAGVHFMGIDVSLAALEFARDSLLSSCPGLHAGRVELVCAEYIQGAHPLQGHFSFSLLGAPKYIQGARV